MFKLTLNLIKPKFISNDLSLFKRNIFSSKIEKKLNLIGSSLPELKSQIEVNYPGIQTYNVKQLYHWIYIKGEKDFNNMLNLSKGLREVLSDKYQLNYGVIAEHLESNDGTIKRLIDYGNNSKIEAVLIPEPGRRTLCVSSQVGCSLACTFCHTGTQKLERNLTSGEIVGQYMGFGHLLKEFPVKELNKRKVSNIVFMGQGEPLYNHRNVFKAIKILTDPTGLNFPKRRITVSTSGVVPMIPKLASELGVGLAISLHGVNDDIRNELVPLNKQFDMRSLFTACHEYSKLSNQVNKRITFEYVMLKGVNDNLKDAKELARLLRKLPSHVNLIPFNPWPGSKYECPELDHIRTFAKEVVDQGVPTTIRFSRGQDIMAACGQLKSLNMNKKSFDALSTTQPISTTVV